MRQLAFNLQLPVDKTFDNFIVNEKNQPLIHTLQTSLINKNAERIFIYGEKSSGKTHLLQAVCNSDQPNAIYLPCHLLLNHQPNVLQEFSNNTLICLDDIDNFAGKIMWETALFNLWNLLQNQSNRLILTANRPIKETHFVLPDLVSRLTQSTIFYLHPLNDQEKTQALRLYIKMQDGYELSDALINYLFTHFSRDLDALLVLLQKLNQLSLENKKNLTIPLLKQLISK